MTLGTLLLLSSTCPVSDFFKDTHHTKTSSKSGSLEAICVEMSGGSRLFEQYFTSLKIGDEVTFVVPF